MIETVWSGQIPETLTIHMRKVYQAEVFGTSIENMWVFPKIGVPQNGWFILYNPIKMDDFGVPLFSETPMSIRDVCGSFQGPMLTRLFPQRGPRHRCAANGSTHLKGRVTKQRANNPNNRSLKRNHKYWR